MMTGIAFVVCFNALFFLFFHLDLNLLLRGLEGPVFLQTLGFTLKQAFISAVLSCALGLLAAPGYARLGRLQRPLRWLFLFPNMMSPVLAVLCLLLTFEGFPFGLTGIVLGHVFLNSGLCAVWLGERWLQLEERWRPVSLVSGGGTFDLFIRVILPQMVPSLKSTLAVVFSLCLTSFAIPLVLGGGPQFSTLEVLIYERIRTEADISSAAGLGLVQGLVQFGVFWLLLRPLLLKTERLVPAPVLSSLSPWVLLTAVVALGSVLPLVSLFKTVIPSLGDLGQIASSEGFQIATQNSVLIALTVGILVMAFISLLTAYGWSWNLLSWPALSGVAVGLGCLILFGTSLQEHRWIFWMALTWGQLAVIFPPVLRLASSQMTSLRSRFNPPVMQSGASPLFALRNVYLPLGLKQYLAGGCLAVCWSLGEFSVASLVGPAQSTLPLYIQGLLGNYRLEEAAVSSMALLFISVVSMTMLEVLTHGLGRRNFI